MSAGEIIRIAAEHWDTDEDTHPEYARAIVELTANLLGLGREENRELVADLIRNERK